MRSFCTRNILATSHHSRALRKLGYDARVMIPRYAGIDQEKYKLRNIYEGLKVPTDAEAEGQPEHLICNVKKFESPSGDHRAPVTAYFLDADIFCLEFLCSR